MLKPRRFKTTIFAHKESLIVSCKLEVGKRYKIKGISKLDSYYHAKAHLVGAIVEVLRSHNFTSTRQPGSKGPDVLILECQNEQFKGSERTFYAAYFSKID